MTEVCDEFSSQSEELKEKKKKTCMLKVSAVDLVYITACNLVQQQAW